MSKDLDKRQDFKLWWTLAWTRETIVRARQKELDQIGLSFIGTGVLFATKSLGRKATPAEISRWLFREPNSVSALLNRMEKKGIIKKSNTLARKNMLCVELTEKGNRAYDFAVKGESIRSIMTTLSEEEGHQLKSSLDKLRGRALKELGIVRKLHWE